MGTEWITESLRVVFKGLIGPGAATTTLVPPFHFASSYRRNSKTNGPVPFFLPLFTTVKCHKSAATVGQSLRLKWCKRDKNLNSLHNMTYQCDSPWSASFARCGCLKCLGTCCRYQSPSTTHSSQITPLFIIPSTVLLSSIQSEAETPDFSTHAPPRNL